MLYIKINDKNKAEVYSCEPEEDYIEVEALPPRPTETRMGYILRLYADMDTQRVWWDYEKLPTKEEIRLCELEDRLRAQSIITAKAMGIEVEVTPEILMTVTSDIPIASLDETAAWKPGIRVQTGDICVDNDIRYMCVQPHVTQADWTPERTPALWTVIPAQTEQGTDSETVVVYLWKQPLGAHDAYKKNDIVSHNSKTWTSDVDNNVWEPGVYGWLEQL